MTPPAPARLAVSFCAFALCLLASAASSPAQVKVGLDVLRDENFKRLEGKRVGLVANPASVDANLTAAADLFREAKNVNVVALFGPEHGLFGNEYAGDTVADRKDERTGVPIYSLYGKTRRPTTQMLQPLDVMVFDLQDIGVRSYTYISTMKNVMDACHEHGVELMILDRPNPLGGSRVEGPMLVKGFESFVGLLPVPYVHGMTMGELAQLTRDTYYPEFKKLTVVKMEGWDRGMTWAETGREWVMSSPHIPTGRAVAGCVATGILGELYTTSIGVGYTLPFEFVGAPHLNGEELAQKLPRHEGVVYRPVYYKPFYSTFKTELCRGIQLHIDPKRADNLVEINYELLAVLGASEQFAQADAKAKREAEEAAAAKAKKDGKPVPAEVKWDPRTTMFDKVSGSDEPRKWLESGRPLEPLFAKWRQQCKDFRKERQKYLLY